MIQSLREIGAPMRALSAYIATALDRPLPAAVAEKAKHHSLDTLAAMVSGAELLPGRRPRSPVRRCWRPWPTRH